MIAESREQAPEQQSEAAHSAPQRRTAPWPASAGRHKATAQRALPKAPLLDWPSLRPASRRNSSSAANSSIETVSHQVLVTSGRAALYQVLRRLSAAPGSGVLVPTYHCPTMVAPIVRAGLRPMFYGLRADGQPHLDGIVFGNDPRPVAMVAVHYFGVPLSLATTRAWCDTNGVTLIEDCAHCFFGEAGARAVGQWGDYAFASLTKFFPLPEAGLLVSNRNSLACVALKRPRWRAQIKGCADLLELAARFGRLRGTATVLRAIFAIKNGLRRDQGVPSTAAKAPEGSCADSRAMLDCDMERADEHPLWISRRLFAWVNRHRIVNQRRENYRAYADTLSHVPGVRAVHPTLPETAAPYAFALLVDDAERVYRALRLQGMPVYRWDRVWPRTPALADDCAPHWRQHLLQLLCHQDLSASDVATVCQALVHLVSTAGAAGLTEIRHA